MTTPPPPFPSLPLASNAAVVEREKEKERSGLGHPLALASVQSALPSLVTTAPEIGR